MRTAKHVPSGRIVEVESVSSKSVANVRFAVLYPGFGVTASDFPFWQCPCSDLREV